MNAPAPLRIPPVLIVLDAVGAIVCALGAYGLMADEPPGFMPALAEPVNAWLLIVLGVAMMGYAVAGILRLALGSGRRR